MKNNTALKVAVVSGIVCLFACLMTLPPVGQILHTAFRTVFVVAAVACIAFACYYIAHELLGGLFSEKPAARIEPEREQYPITFVSDTEDYRGFLTSEHTDEFEPAEAVRELQNLFLTRHVVKLTLPRLIKLEKWDPERRELTIVLLAGSKKDMAPLLDATSVHLIVSNRLLYAEV